MSQDEDHKLALKAPRRAEGDTLAGEERPWGSLEFEKLRETLEKIVAAMVPRQIKDDGSPAGGKHSDHRLAHSGDRPD
jgi:hypothetical protein